MRSKEGVRHIQHIASMGLAQHVAIPAMVDALHDVVPANQFPFCWTNEDGMVADFYGPDVIPQTLEALMVMDRHNTPDDVPTIDRVLQGPLAFNNTALHRQLGGWSHSAYFNDMLRGNLAENSIDFPLRDASGVRGAISVARGVNDRPMQAGEMRRVAALLPHFIHAMNAEPTGNMPEISEACDAVFIISTIAGDIMSYSAGGANRILQLYNSPLGKGVKFGDYLNRLPPAAMLVVDRLKLIQSGRSAQPASLEVPTRWGLFRISAVPMQAASNLTSETVMVTIRPLIDKRLARAQRLIASDLTLAERRVALRMAGFGGGDAIARDLGLSIGAYRQYAKRIYAALGVEGRIGVKAMLDS
jgi:hypothetical protein